MNVLSLLDSEQQIAVKANPGRLCIVAGAGTGKTTTLVARTAYQCGVGNWDPGAVLALTHSTKASGNIRGRLNTISYTTRSVTAKTFHATALALYKESLTGTNASIRLTTNPHGVVREALRRNMFRSPETSLVMDALNEISWAKASLVVPSDYAKVAGKLLRSVSGLSLSQVCSVYAEYNNVLFEAKEMDFSDLLASAVSALEKNSTFADIVRKRYRHFLVDEYQDTDPLQEKLLQVLLNNRSDITVVGDKRQAVYGFKGAQVELLDEFACTPETLVVNLVRNYRATPELAKAANVLMRTPTNEELIGQQPSGPSPSLVVADDESSEVQRVVNLIKGKLASGYSPEDVAVLYRFNSQSAAFEQALSSASIPYVVVDSEKFFDRPEIVQVLREGWSKMCKLENIESSISPPGDYESVSGLELLRSTLSDFGFVREDPPGVAGSAQERWEAYNALLESVESMHDSESLTSREVFNELAIMKKESHEITLQAVTLSTLHKAKGLEWALVFMPRMVEGSLPSAFSKTVKDLEEEKRLMYVGMTRAKKELVLSYAKMRKSGNRKWSSSPSNYLNDIGLMVNNFSKTNPRQTSSTRSSVTPVVAFENTALFKALLSWRSNTAKLSKVPDFSIISEPALIHIACSRPKDLKELLKTPGVGSVKLKKYSNELLEIVQVHLV